MPPVTCKRCGQAWARDPALEVRCPQCKAPVGRKCRRPSGHDCELHSSRDQAAVDAGLLKKCTGANNKPQQQQLLLGEDK